MEATINGAFHERLIPEIYSAGSRGPAISRIPAGAFERAQEGWFEAFRFSRAHGGCRQPSACRTVVTTKLPRSGLVQLDEWCRQAMRSRLEPMKKIARSLRNHRELILNYFRAQKQLPSGVVEGLNNKAKVTMRKSYGFRTYRVLELALYHSLGKLPEPESTHDFF